MVLYYYIYYNIKILCVQQRIRRNLVSAHVPSHFERSVPSSVFTSSFIRPLHFDGLSIFVSRVSSF